MQLYNNANCRYGVLTSHKSRGKFSTHTWCVPSCRSQYLTKAKGKELSQAGQRQDQQNGGTMLKPEKLYAACIMWHNEQANMALSGLNAQQPLPDTGLVCQHTLHGHPSFCTENMHCMLSYSVCVLLNSAANQILYWIPSDFCVFVIIIIHNNIQYQLIHTHIFINTFLWGWGWGVKEGV